MEETEYKVDSRNLQTKLHCQLLASNSHLSDLQQVWLSGMRSETLTSYWCEPHNTCWLYIEAAIRSRTPGHVRYLLLAPSEIEIQQCLEENHGFGYNCTHIDLTRSKTCFDASSFICLSKARGIGLSKGWGWEKCKFYE